MSQAAFLQSRPGKYLDSDSVRITDEQIILAEPKTIEIRLFRNEEANDEAIEAQFEIEVMMSWGNLFTLFSCDTEEEAKATYELIVRSLKGGQSRIQIGDEFFIVPSQAKT